MKIISSVFTLIPIIIVFGVIGMFAWGIYYLLDLFGFFGGCTDDENTIEPGDTCQSDCQCKPVNGNEGYCGRYNQSESGGVDTLVCCPSGTGHTRGAKSYCDNLPEHFDCQFDDDCEGGKCRDNNFGTKKGICGKAGAGANCDTNSDCNSNQCAWDPDPNEKNTGYGYVCCPTGESSTRSTGNWFREYCHDVLEIDEECSYDFQCINSFCHKDEGVCKPLVTDYHQCSGRDDDSCHSTICGQMRTNVDGATQYQCCPANPDKDDRGQKVNVWGADWCSDLEIGELCSHDKQCKSKLCTGEDNVTPFTCQELIAEGSGCSRYLAANDDECAVARNGNKGVCAQYDDNIYRCCPDGEFTTFAGAPGEEWCTHIPLGEPCFHDDQCAYEGGYCNVNVCARAKVAWAKCDRNEECGTGQCGTTDNNNEQCCVDTDNLDRCTNMPPGTLCINGQDDRCSTGVCAPDSTGTHRCMGLQGEGGSCSSDNDCGNNTCGHLIDGEPEVCCWGSNRSNDRCTNLNIGQSCSVNDQCRSGYCPTAPGSTSPNTCQEKISDWSSCGEFSPGENCASGTCGQLRNNEYICCAGGNSIGTFETWCSDLDPDKPCDIDGQCKSGKCDGDRCTNEIGPGQPCPTTDNEQCTTNQCGQYNNNNYRCCPSGMGLLGTVQDWCINLNNGTQCEYDSQCQTGVCNNNRCVQLVADWGTCDDDSDCAHGRCSNREGDISGSDICCPGGRTKGCGFLNAATCCAG